MYKKCTSDSYIHTINVATYCTKFKQTANWKELGTWNACFLHIHAIYNIQTIQNVTFFVYNKYTVFLLGKLKLFWQDRKSCEGQY